ncbi:hypothetical protein HNP11_001132 [Tsukamurella ocularis]|nr:hypothetical protein [Tsukamurella ocularis]MCS3786968.1 hypothetical protein [Tsukamurella ocularis]MCS3850810.1 hypothetical protein [Tsukamurella ocularis]
MSISVTVLMHGRPATIHGARAFETFRGFCASANA